MAESKEQAEAQQAEPFEPWKTYPEFNYEFLDKDFLEPDAGQLRLNYASSKGGVHIDSIAQRDKAAWSVRDSTNFWINLAEGRHISARSNSDGQIKVHYNHGLTEIFKKSMNVYGTLNVDRRFSKICWKLGAQHVGEVCNSDNRIRVDIEERANWTWYNHTILQKHNCVFGLSNYFDLSQKRVGQTKILAGYNWNKWSFWLRTQNEEWQQLGSPLRQWLSQFNQLSLSAIAKHDDKTQYGFQAQFGLDDKTFKQALFAVERQLPQGHLKAKISSLFEVFLNFRAPLWCCRERGLFSLGFRASDIGKPSVKLSYGALLEFNV